MDFKETGIQENEISLINREESQVSLFENLFKFSWQKFFPYSYEKNINERNQQVSFEISNSDEVNDFVKNHYKEIFSKNLEESPFTILKSSPFKEAFSRICMDHFIFKVDDEPIGFFMGNLVDWESYYLRYINILPNFRRYQISMDFYHYFLDVLNRVGVNKAEAHLSSNNSSQIKKLIKLGFILTGQQLTIRWGTLANFSKYFDEDENHKFQGQFFL